MGIPLVKQKVVCYIVREGHLLVFRHLDEPWAESGLQVPAGSVRTGETPEVAALREAAEETGLTSLRLVRKVGEIRAARASGMSWSAIGAFVGTSGEAARQRYAHKVA